MRKDGRLIRSFEPMHRVAAYIMRERNDALNMIRLDIPADPIQQFINEKRKEAIRYSHLAVYIAAFVRTLAEYPMLNRFVVNRKIYARNEIAIGMVVLKPGKTEGTMNKMFFQPSDTLQDVENKLKKYVEENRKDGETNKTDQLINRLLAFPGLCYMGTGILMWMDKHGLLPKSIIDASPFHCSMTITNLGSIGTNYIYHHVYNFGTTSMVLALGRSVEVPKRRNGEIVFEKCTPIGMCMDERIGEGCEFAIAFQRFEKYLKNPELLELPPTVINEDIK